MTKFFVMCRQLLPKREAATIIFVIIDFSNSVTVSLSSILDHRT